MRYPISVMSWIVVAGLLLSCDPQKSENEHLSVVDVGPFGSYVSLFQQKAAEVGATVQITDLIVKFGPMSQPLEHGYCEMGDGLSPTIVVDEPYWNRVQEGARESLLFHEMGHCVLHRKHVSGLTDQGVPVSLMNPYTISAAVFDYNETYYMHELFSVTNTL